MSMHKYLSLFLALLAVGCTQRTDVSDPLVAIQIQDRNGLTETISMPERLLGYEKIDFLSSQPYKKVARVYKRMGKSHSVITTYHPNGVIAQYLEAEEMRAHGFYREWFPNGQMRIEAIVIGGSADVSLGASRDWLFDEISRVWDEQGNLIATIPYQKGVLQGVSTHFYPSGSVQRKIPYVKNLEEGESLDFYPDGRLRSKINYRMGTKKGESVGFFETGSQAWREEYIDGLLLKGLYYDAKGKSVAETMDGRGWQASYEGDRLRALQEIRQGVQEGEVKQFTQTGELQSSYSTKSGKKHGEELVYYLASGNPEKPTPQTKLSIQWDQGAVHGVVKTWYENGQLQSQREYCRNQRLGPSCAWYKNGSLMFVEEYEEGRLQKGAYYKKNQNEPISTIFNGNGIAHLYDEEGVFMKKVTYAKGKPQEPEE
ncbi:MAG: hypothetical protein HY861_03035 [Chlamydiia bacterium]|nr:hypothetical protein [Chlamydiia bacterium]